MRPGLAGPPSAQISLASSRHEVSYLGGPLLGLARKAPVDGHARHQLVVEEAVVLLLGIPYGRDQDPAVGRPGGMVDLSLGQACCGCTTATVALY
jgi:hypothetical protein